MNLDNIPVIDIAHLNRQRTLTELDVACRDWGFFQVVNHGIPEIVTEALCREMRTFFARPRAAKREVLRTRENPWGFFDRELTKNTLDWKEIYDYGPADGDLIRPQWPRAMPTFRHAVHAYYDACESLAFRLIAAISENLGMPKHHLGSFFRDSHTSFLRLNYYPRCPKPERPQGLDTPKEGHLGLNQHTDAGALTLLLQDEQPGLEVFRYGEWHLVEPRAGALVINIGDIVQVWSNDRYRAAVHRVIANHDAERFSVPFFFCPSYATEYTPLSATIDEDHPARYRPINWGEFKALRSAGDFADHGEEIQIYHYLQNHKEASHAVHRHDTSQ